MKKRQLLLPALLAVAAIAMAGCDLIHTAVLDIGQREERSLTRTFTYMSGISLETVSIQEGENPEIRFDVQLEKGQLDVTVADSQGTELYQKSIEGEERFTVELEQSGSYKLTLKSQDSSGKYEISWGDPPTAESKEEESQ